MGRIVMPVIFRKYNIVSPLISAAPHQTLYEIIDANTVTRAHSQISDEGMQRTHHNINSDTRSLSSSACFFREVYVHVKS